jgi:membrane associated rhomboid family serine protease
MPEPFSYPLPVPVPQPRPPMINLPPGVKALIVLLIVIHLAQHLMPVWLNDKLILSLGYIPHRYWILMHGYWAGTGFEIVASPVTYMFLHASWMHLGINVLSLAAFGTAVETVAGPRFMTGLFLICGVMGAFTEFACAPLTHEIIIGASAGISGLFAVAFLSMARRQGIGGRQLAGVTLMTVAVMVVMGMVGMPAGPGGHVPVAWISHVGGFLSGVAAEQCMSRDEFGNPNHDIGWAVALLSLPLLVLLLNVAR